MPAVLKSFIFRRPLPARKARRGVLPLDGAKIYVEKGSSERDDGKANDDLARERRKLRDVAGRDSKGRLISAECVYLECGNCSRSWRNSRECWSTVVDFMNRITETRSRLVDRSVPFGKHI